MGFLSASVTVDVWFVLNRILDLIFILDMLLQFCVVYQSVQETVNGDSAWVTERRKIFRHYALGWFPLDILSILPSAFDYVPFFLSAGEGDGAQTEKLSGFRAIRALRLIKLVRLLRASRLLSRWKARVGLSYSSSTILSIISIMCLAAHWYACILALQATLHDDCAVTWLGHQQHCHTLPPEHAQEDLTSAERFALQCPGCVDRDATTHHHKRQELTQPTLQLIRQTVQAAEA